MYVAAGLHPHVAGAAIAQARGGSDHCPTYVDLATAAPGDRGPGVRRVRLAFMRDAAAADAFSDWVQQAADSFVQTAKQAGQQAARRRADVQEAEDDAALAQ